MEPPRGRVLVVDDNAENRALAQATLEDEGYELDMASSGDEALAAFARTPPDCVLLDIRMPGMDGITACKRMRELPDGTDIPILFLTAQRDVDTFDKAQAAGGDDYITKPVRPTELVTRVGNAVKQRRMAAERGELYAQLRQQRDDLMRMQLQKEQLTAFLVHDLKNPVHAIGLHAQRVLRDSSASERTRDAVLKINDESQALLRMIVNLLDLSKADEGQLTPAVARIDARALVDSVVEAMRVRAQTSAVTLVVEVADGLVLVGDADLARRIVENLVDNAIRHAPEDTPVTITAVAATGGTEVRIADAGAGVPEDKKADVFDRFVSHGGRSNRGLGLSFCKQAIEAHRGRIWIEDAAPGAVFCVWFPDVAK